MSSHIVIWLLNEKTTFSFSNISIIILINFGLMLNIHVIFRMLKMFRSDKDQVNKCFYFKHQLYFVSMQFFNGTGIYIMSMAICDALNLLMSSVEIAMPYVFHHSNETTRIVMCKVIEFKWSSTKIFQCL